MKTSGESQAGLRRLVLNPRSQVVACEQARLCAFCRHRYVNALRSSEFIFASFYSDVEIFSILRR